MSEITHTETPNYTQIPNVFFDHWMAILTPMEFKVLLCIARKTFGWHKNKESISITQLMKLSDASRQGVINSVKELECHKLIIKERHQSSEHGNEANTFLIRVFTPKKTLKSDVAPIMSVQGADQQSRPGLVNSIDYLKETNIKKEEKLLTQTTTTREAQASQNFVVVPLFLSEISGLSDAEALRLLDLFGEDRIKAKIPVLEAAPGVEVPFGFLRKAVEENWQVRQTPEDRVPENRKWAKSVLDGRFIGPVRVEALNTRLEFIYEGQREPDCFEYGLANFKDVVGAHYRSVQARLKGG